MANAVQGVKAIFGGNEVKNLQKALSEAHSYEGLSLVHIPVYAGNDQTASMGAYGVWNVGNWVEDVQTQHMKSNI